MSRTGYTIKKKLTQSEFDSLLASVSVEKSYLLTQQADRIKFTRFDQNEMLQAGRIFNNNYEIRYEKIDDGYDVLVFSEQKEKFEELKLSGTPNKYDLAEENNIFLLGKSKQRNGKWMFIETQIPQILEYPVDDLELKEKSELVIKAIDYRRNELPCFTRFKGVEIYDSGSK